MAKSWSVKSTINGRQCIVHYSEWKYLGDSTIRTSHVEYIDKDKKENVEVDRKIKERNVEKGP